MYFAIVCLPSFSPTDAHAVLTECVSASVSVIWPKFSLPKLRSGTPEIGLRFLPLTVESGVKRAAVHRRDRRDDLERRPGRVAGLRRAVEQRRVRVAVEPGELARLRDVVRVVAGHRRHGLDRAGLRVERDDGALAAVEPLERGALGARGRAS